MKCWKCWMAPKEMKDKHLDVPYRHKTLMLLLCDDISHGYLWLYLSLNVIFYCTVCWCHIIIIILIHLYHVMYLMHTHARMSCQLISLHINQSLLIQVIHMYICLVSFSLYTDIDFSYSVWCSPFRTIHTFSFRVLLIFDYFPATLNILILLHDRNT